MKLENLGRRINDQDKAAMAWALRELAIDQHSGFGYKGKVSDGSICPRPYYENDVLNRNKEQNWKTNVPKKLFALWREQQLACFFYSNLRLGRLVINIDCDNKDGKIPSGKRNSVFWRKTFSLLRALGLSGAYTQRSTNGKGTHSYLNVKITPDNWVDENGNRRSFLELSLFAREVLSNLQNAIRTYWSCKGIQINVDVLGSPAAYDWQGNILVRGSWVKMPFDMHKTNKRKRFEKRQTVSLRFISDSAARLLKLSEKLMASGHKPSIINPKPLKSSTETEGRWDLRNSFKSFFQRHFGDKSIPFYKRSLLSMEEFADYLIAFETASRVTQNGKPKEAFWKNSLPVKLIQLIFDRNTKNSNNLANRKFDFRKYRFIFSFISNYKLITVINSKHSYKGNDLYGNETKGIARKWFVNRRFFSFFPNYNLEKQIFIAEITPYSRILNTFLGFIISGNSFKRVITPEPPFGLKRSQINPHFRQNITQKPVYHLRQ